VAWVYSPYVFGTPGSGSISPSYGSGSGSFYHQTKIIRKTWIPTAWWLLYDILSLKNDVNVPSKSINVGVLKVDDEIAGSWSASGQRLQTRIRIHTKMSWIRNTALVLVILSPLRVGSARYGATTWRKSSNKSAGSRRNILTWPWTRNFQAWWRDPSANLNLPPIISTSSSGSLRWFSCDFFSLLHKIALSHILNLCRWSLVCALLQEIWICIWINKS
jgi:hypothetical protein